MQCGFAMLCAGAVRSKNAKNIILLNLLDACFGCCMWYITGFAFAYGDPTNDGDTFNGSQAFIGNRFFCMSNLPADLYSTWFFQFTFAATAATIVSGAVCERCRFQAYVAYEVMLVGFVYPVVAHWVWSPYGWLSAFRDESTSAQGYIKLFGTGVYDFAGDGPVHMIGGIASLVGAWILGPRMGRYDASGNPQDMPGHNASLTILGVFFLWFGWYGFNPGSTLGVSDGLSEYTALVAINTTLGAASGTISTLLIVMIHEYIKTGTMVYDLLMAGNGTLGGLVAITGGAAFVYPWAAFIIGFIGGGVYYIASKVNLHILKVDDPLDAIAVHLGCGIWGLIAVAAFIGQKQATFNFGDDAAYGFFMGGGYMGGRLLAAQLLYIVMIIVWTAGIMTPFFFLLKKTGNFRVAPEVESAGLDVSHHGGSAYPYTKPEDKPVASSAGGMSEKEIDMKIEEALSKFKASIKSE
jgi:Amt family ammonium transporter